MTCGLLVAKQSAAAARKDNSGPMIQQSGGRKQQPPPVITTTAATASGWSQGIELSPASSQGRDEPPEEYEGEDRAEPQLKIGRMR